VMKHISKKSKRIIKQKKFLSRSTVCVITTAAMLCAVCVPVFAESEEAEAPMTETAVAASTDEQSAEPTVQPSESAEASETADVSEEPSESAESSKTPEESETAQPSASAKPTVSAEPSDSDIEKENPPIEDGKDGDGIDWEAIPSWVGSADTYMTANLALMLEVEELDKELKDQIEVIRKEFGMSKDAEIVYGDENITDIIAVYALISDMTDNYPNKVEIADDDQKEVLRSVFWMMTSVSGSVTEKDGSKAEQINVQRLTYSEVKSMLDLSNEQEKQLKSLMSDDSKKAVKNALEGTIVSKLSSSELNNIAVNISGLSSERQAVIAAGLSLVGKVPYFWGGKSYTIGWDSRWGSYAQVTSSGSTTTGSMRAYGLDCSGFVSWAFINAAGDKDILGRVGSGTANQWRCSKAISWDEAKPGDLVFYRSPNGTGTNHVGILVGKKNGSWQVVHCSSSRNCVVLTGLENFKYVRRPYVYKD
jgi:cell wall-associated NlpC family hydrolase